MIRLHVEKPGLHSLVQDSGRAGLQQYGVPLGGPLDRGAARMANQLVQNPPDTPVVELTLGGPLIRFEGSCQIALCGADLSPSLNGAALASHQTIEVPDGATLQFGNPRSGCRAYLAVRGIWSLPRWLGSHSAFLQYTPSPTPESILSKGQVIHIRPFPTRSPQIILHPGAAHAYSEPLIRVWPGPEFGLFSGPAIASFFGRRHRLSADSNRMGYRLTEPLDDIQPLPELISSGIVPGTIQVPPSGIPILLLADAQTVGGYPRIANVLQADLDRLAQLRPGDWLRFEWGVAKHQRGGSDWYR